MVNSDQTWRRFDKNFFDIGFLKFAQNWSIPKFVYGASFGYNQWRIKNEEENLIKKLLFFIFGMKKYLLKNFTGISVREKGAVNLVKKHLDIKAI